METIPLRFGHVELFVRDVGASREFYEQLLGFEVTAVQGGGRVVWLKKGTFEMLLRPGAPHPAASYQQTGAAMVLYCKDIEATAERLRAAGLHFKGTDGAPQCLTFTDPDGHWFQLVDPDGVT